MSNNLESVALYQELAIAESNVNRARLALQSEDLDSPSKRLWENALRNFVGTQIELASKARAAEIVEFGSKRISPDFFEAFLEIFDGCGRNFSQAIEIFEGLVKTSGVKKDELLEAR